MTERIITPSCRLVPERRRVWVQRGIPVEVGGEQKRHKYRELIADNGLDAGAMSLNENLQKAKRQKNDEFYTQLSDIENELR